MTSPRFVVTVALGERAYPIHLEPGLLTRAAELLAEHFSSRDCVVVTSEPLIRSYGEPLFAALRNAGFTARLCALPDGEAQKNLDSAQRIVDVCLEAGLDRRSFLVALGGGVIGDLAGFAASIYMRGIDFVQVPTTLLAQVDASVGGKVAVNHPRAKNLLGTFHQPRLVLVDPLTLRTLPRREFCSGLAEVIKYGVILDAEFFAFVETQLDAILALEPAALTHIIRRSCELKAGLVERDERDTGERALLNYGHTAGHAIEACDYGALTHGEAVAIGMSVAARLAQKLGRVEEAFVNRQNGLLRRAGLPVAWSHARVEEALVAMRHDKKTAAGRLNFVLPDCVGHAEVVTGVPVEVVRAALEESAA